MAEGGSPERTLSSSEASESSPRRSWRARKPVLAPGLTLKKLLTFVDEVLQLSCESAICMPLYLAVTLLCFESQTMFTVKVPTVDATNKNGSKKTVYEEPNGSVYEKLQEACVRRSAPIVESFCLAAHKLSGSHVMRSRKYCASFRGVEDVSLAQLVAGLTTGKNNLDNMGGKNKNNNRGALGVFANTIGFRMGPLGNYTEAETKNGEAMSKAVQASINDGFTKTLEDNVLPKSFKGMRLIEVYKFVADYHNNVLKYINRSGHKVEIVNRDNAQDKTRVEQEVTVNSTLHLHFSGIWQVFVRRTVLMKIVGMLKIMFGDSEEYAFKNTTQLMQKGLETINHGLSACPFP
ncbi:hypothetical protein DPMN_087258 [Dreissena polymorpha]|uniref:Uncharacterized protein n=1 Tax=Dreissena polymorpha TaxID=45954 RepID=A0A9D4KSN0_DREPO|nr:hypothetical protein DPMN_087258 [Dreissena polymorpha]